MAATKFVLLFAALFVASVSADAVQNIQTGWDTLLGELQNATQKMVTELNAATVSNNNLIDIVTTQTNAIKANLTELFNSVKEEATKKGGENVEKLKAAADKMIKTVSEKLDLGTDVTPEKIKQSVASGFETISSQFHNLTSSLEAPVNEITQTFTRSLQQATSAVENIAQKIHTNAGSS